MKRVLQLQNRIREVKNNLFKDRDMKSIDNDLLTIENEYRLPLIFHDYLIGHIFYRARVVNNLSNLTHWKQSDFLGSSN